MKKRIASLIMASVFVISMAAGCGSSNNAAESADSAAESTAAESTAVESTAVENTAAESTAAEADAVEEKETLKYGKSFGLYTPLFEEAVMPVLEEQGYTFEALEVDDVIQNDTALMDGDVDFNVEQHAPYIATFNESYGADLTPTSIHLPTMPYYLFSNTYEKLEDIEKGAKLLIAVPNDGSNLPRALSLCEQVGLITLKDGVAKDEVNYEDIVSSDYEIEWKEMDTTTIPSILDDVDFGLVTGGNLINAKMDAKEAFGAEESISEDMLLVLCVRGEDADKQWVKDIEAAYKSDEFKAYMAEHQADYSWIIPAELQ